LISDYEFPVIFHLLRMVFAVHSISLLNIELQAQIIYKLEGVITDEELNRLF